MKKYIILFTLIVITVFCSSATNDQRRIDSIPSTDTTCLKEIRAAKNDIVNGKLIYCRNTGSMVAVFLRNADEFKTLLKRYDIGYREVGISDRWIRGQTQGCYMDFMNRAISEKYGATFIDSLLNVSDSLFVKKRANGTFHQRECDELPKYPGDESPIGFVDNSTFQKEFESIKYPADYVNNYRSSVDVHILVDKKGNASILDYKFHFTHSMNDKHVRYFKKEISKILKRSDWRPAIIRNQIVTADFYNRIDLR